MPELILETLDGVEDSLHDAYEEKDGKFHLNVDKYADLKAAGTKANAAALKKEKDKLRAEFDAFKKKFDGIADDDLPTFREWKERRALTGDDDDPGDKKSAETLAAKYQQTLKAEREKLEKAKAEEVAAVKSAADTWKNKWKSERLSNRLSAYAAKAGVFAEDVETFVDLLLSKNLFDIGEDEEILFLQDGQPSAITAEKAINETLREKYKRFYEAPAQGGSGSSGGGKRRNNGVDYSKMPATQRLEAARKAGITK